MKKKLERFVERMIQQTDCTKSEKEDLYEELLIHLELLRDEFLQKGFSLEEAENKAIESFGSDVEIGHHIQQALFPFRKEMMLGLASSSLFFTIIVYLANLFLNGDAEIIWLVLSMTVSSTLFLLSVFPFGHAHRKRYMNTLLIAHLLLYVYGYMIASHIDHTLSLFLTTFAAGIIVLAVILLYRITLFGDVPSPAKSKVWIHAIFLTTGLFIGSVSLVFIMSGFILLGTFHPMMLVFISPLIVWGVLYVWQMRLYKKKQQISYLLVTMPILICFAILAYFLYLRFI
jgi:hypothetical protein